MSKATNLRLLTSEMGFRDFLDGVYYIVQPLIYIECVGWENPRNLRQEDAFRLYRARTLEIRFRRSENQFWTSCNPWKVPSGEHRISLQRGRWTQILEWLPGHLEDCARSLLDAGDGVALAFPTFKAGFDSERIIRALRPAARHCFDRLGRGSEV